MKTAAELISLGADCPALMSKLFFSKPLAYVKFEAEMLLNHLKTEFDGKYAWLAMDDSVLAKYGLEKKDTEDLIDSVKALRDVEIAAVLYKSEKGVKFSLRSKNKKISVAKIAREIGGGGHEMAAGGLAAVIMGRDGIALSQFRAESSDVDIETLGIEYANLYAEIGKAAETLGSGSVQEVMLLTDQYQILIRGINPEYFIALILAPDGNLGKGRFLLRVSVPKIVAEL